MWQNNDFYKNGFWRGWGKKISLRGKICGIKCLRARFNEMSFGEVEAENGRNFDFVRIGEERLSLHRKLRGRSAVEFHRI